MPQSVERTLRLPIVNHVHCNQLPRSDNSVLIRELNPFNHLRHSHSHRKFRQRGFHYHFPSEMAIETLFDRCPPIPLDDAVPISRYVRNVRQIVREVKEAEDANDLETAAVLQIRILLLICKTLPSHPDYDLIESKPAIKELRGIAHTGFANIERLSDALSDDKGFVADADLSTSSVASFGVPCVVQLSVTLLELFERIAAENTVKCLTTVGLLAARATDDQIGNVSRVAALIIPSQTCLSERSDIRYETDILQLLKVKGLVRLGFVEMCPNRSRNSLSPISARLLAQLQRAKPEAVGIVIAPQDTSRICSYSLTDEGLSYVLSCTAQEKFADELVPIGRRGEGKAAWGVAKHSEIRRDGEPPFKLYDLRPLAEARDEQERNVKVEAAR